MGSSASDSFDRPSFLTEMEWLLLLTAQAGPLRTVYGGGPTNRQINAGATVLLSSSATSMKRPLFVQVQVVPGAPPPAGIFMRSPGGATSGVLHDFAVERLFRQILMPGDQLFFLDVGGVPTNLLVFEVIV